MHQRRGDGIGSVQDMLSDVSSDVAAVLDDPELWRLPSREVVASLLGELDARGLAGEAGAPSTWAWLAATRRMRPQDAKRDVTLAQLLHTAEIRSCVDGDGGNDGGGTPDAPAEGVAVLAGLAAGTCASTRRG